MSSFIQNRRTLVSKGNNIGVEHANGSTFVFNPDTVVAEDTFTKVLAFAENKKDWE
jgi:GT2 family glycosyltransferase